MDYLASPIAYILEAIKNTDDSYPIKVNVVGHYFSDNYKHIQNDDFGTWVGEFETAEDVIDYFSSCKAIAVFWEDDFDVSNGIPLSELDQVLRNNRFDVLTDAVEDAYPQIESEEEIQRLVNKAIEKWEKETKALLDKYKIVVHFTELSDGLAAIIESEVDPKDSLSYIKNFLREYTPDIEEVKNKSNLLSNNDVEYLFYLDLDSGDKKLILSSTSKPEY